VCFTRTILNLQEIHEFLQFTTVWLVNNHFIQNEIIIFCIPFYSFSCNMIYAFPRVRYLFVLVLFNNLGKYFTFSKVSSLNLHLVFNMFLKSYGIVLFLYICWAFYFIALCLRTFNVTITLTTTSSPKKDRKYWSWKLTIYHLRSSINSV